MSLPDDWEALAIPPRESWMDDGLCAQIGGTFWDSPDNDVRGGTSYKVARRVCLTCPVVDPCAIYGVAHETEGMWGGLSPMERASLRREESA